ncbi:MAG: hypothetical protein HY903_22050 [Deltaproteobacteria bacterium]|nr:hypothetical protein [Deltaproteobacteria bacterium]
MLLPADGVAEVARRFLRYFPVSSGDRIAFEVEEVLWRSIPAPPIPRKFRHELARRIEGNLYLHPEHFLHALEQLWIIDDAEPIELLLGSRRSTLRDEIERHVLQNPGDWSVEYLFERLGAFTASDRRFARLLEALSSSDVRPQESSQRAFAADVNHVLGPCGVVLRETGIEEGYPVFSLVANARGVQGRPKNLIFASNSKPEIRFRDALNNDIECLSNDVLIYDRPFPPNGVRWRDLQEWWADLHALTDADLAKTTLYKRLRECLPRSSPPQRLLFDAFHESFARAVPGLPALLPEVWLHYDPRVVEARGREALLRQRMDFLMVLSHEVRVVIEVDGKHHYSDQRGVASPGLYAEMVAADRDLRLLGYEVYRFGAAELQGDQARGRVREFFERLFRRHDIAITG